MVPLQVRVDLEAMAMKSTPHSLKTRASPSDCCHIQDASWESLTPCAEMHSVYSTAPADSTRHMCIYSLSPHKQDVTQGQF